MTPEQLSMLQHSLGADQYGQRTRHYDRRYIACDPKSPSQQRCEELVAMGLMKCNGSRPEIYGSLIFYEATDAGVSAMLKESTAPPKKTRAQRRYEKFLS
jgi:hypothetical protein